MVCECLVVCEVDASVESVLLEPDAAVAEDFLDAWHEIVALDLAVVGLCLHGVVFRLLVWVGV